MSELFVQVDQRGGKLIVASYSRPSGWAWFMNGWFEILDVETDEAAFGDAINRALERSETGVPKPSRELTRAGFDRPILEALGLRNTSAYMNGTRSVAVSRAPDSAALQVTPKENRGRDGFVEMRDAKESLTPEAGAREVAAAVRRALERAGAVGR